MWNCAAVISLLHEEILFKYDKDGAHGLLSLASDHLTPSFKASRWITAELNRFYHLSRPKLVKKKKNHLLVRSTP